MKNTLKKLLMSAGLSFSSAVIAQPTVELIWTSTTGEGVIGSSEITAEPGDMLTLDILVHADFNGLVAAGIPLYWDAGDLTAYSPQECPSPPNTNPGICDDASNNTGNPRNPGVNIGPGSAEAFDFLVDFSVMYLGRDTATLGRINFYVEASATTEEIIVDYSKGDFGVLDGNWISYAPPASAIIKPPLPPGC